jgi:hypothetical protein
MMAINSSAPRGGARVIFIAALIAIFSWVVGALCNSPDSVHAFSTPPR